jgi:hypothetical protein
MSTRTGTAEGKFKSIRKWAEQEGYKVKNWDGYQSITIFTEVGQFEVANRESTIYHSIRGMRGNPKGVYLSIPGFVGSPYSSQKEILNEIKDYIDRRTKR